MVKTGQWCVCALMLLTCGGTGSAAAATIYVAAGANLQTALNAAQPGDTILLEEGAEFVGNFVLPAKNGDGWITVRTSAPDSVLPPAGVRIHPSHAPLLARLRSSNASAVLRTAAGAHHWDLRYLEFGPNRNGFGDILVIGDGSSAQNTLDKVPHHFILNHIYLHGDPAFGQKRGISLNAAHVTITDSYLADCKGVGLDTQAIAGWNGPGPYLIENNYLEGAGENVMFGGADPSIAGMVADGITIRRNYFSRPMAWREPILSTPPAVAAVAEAGGSLGSGVYAYRVVARGPVGLGVTARSTASAEVSAQVLASGGAVRIKWQPVAGATEYRVYGRTAGAQATYWATTSTQFVDTGQAGTAEAVPTTMGTRWSVKNLFELKNARNVVVEHNVFENHWPQAQSGYSILFTPRNSNGGCTWCGVENVRFEYNLIRNVSAGFNILGYDDPSRPSRQTRNLVIRHNLFQKMTTALGGNGWFMLIGDGPRDIVIEHNTIDNDGSTVIAVYGGTSTDAKEVYGFVMTANAARHGKYGMNGSYFGCCNKILNGYYPDAVFTANYLAGGTASLYPAGNLFAGIFADQFVDPTRGDFTVRTTSALKSAAPDGSDIGVDFAKLVANLQGVEAGLPPNVPTPPSASFTTACTALDCTFTNGSRPGSSQIASMVWNYGDGLTGTQAQHAYATAGTYSVTLTVTDLNGLSATASAMVTVEAPTVPCSYTVSPASQAVAAGGGTGSFSVAAAAGCTWTATSGASWITVTSSTTGSGNGTVAFSAAANSTTSSRSGTIGVGGQTFTISQGAAPSCSYTVSPASQAATAAGGTGSFSITAAAGCTWTASSGVSWITLKSSATGSGNGTVAFSTATNGTTTARTGTITAGGQSFTVNQAANSSTCSYAISPTSASMSAFGGTNWVTLTAPAGCGWTATSNASWLSIISSTSGTGSAMLTYSGLSNSGSARTGTLTIAGKTFTVSQSAAACSYTVSPTSISVSASGGTGTISMSATSGCNWSSASSVSWITVSGSGSGSGSVTYTVAANTLSTSRTGTILVGGRTVSFTQAAVTAATK